MTAAPTILPVRSRRDRRDFLRFERDHYAGDPNWVPPIWAERKKLVGFKPHPFYDDAEATAFLARRDGRVIGRVVAIVNHAHNRHYDERRGFFGFFECEDDETTATSLLNTAAEHLRDKGMTAVRGPIHPSLNYEVGCLVDGFDTPPTFLIPYNHAYYDRLIKSAGFEKSQDVFSFQAHVDLLNDLDPKMKFVVDEAAKRFDVKCRPIDKSNFDADVRAFLDIYNRSLQQTWGYVPMSPAEVADQAKGLKLLIVPELTSIAEIDGKPVGAGFGMLDYNPIIKRIGGHIFPFGWLRILTDYKKLDRLRLISTNVLPEYQKWGLGILTIARMLPGAIDFGVEIGEFSWVLESNRLSANTIRRGGAKLFKTHRIYDRNL